MKRTGNKMLDNLWQYRGKNLVEVSTTHPSNFHVRSSSNVHGYVVGGRSDAAFSSMPEYSFLDFKPGNGLCVSADVEAVGDARGQWVITLYSADGSRTNHWGSTDHVEALTEENTVRASLAFRIKGVGEIDVSNIRMDSFWSNITKPIEIKLEVTNAQKIRYTARVFTINENGASSALIACQFFDSNHHMVAPIATTAINPRFGAYQYAVMSIIGDADDMEYSFDVPEEAATAEIVILPWKDPNSMRIGAPPTAVPTFSPDDRAESSIDVIGSFVRGIATGDSLIIQHTTAPILGHPSLLLRPNRLAKEFADLGSKVIFLPFSRVEGGVSLIDESTLMVSRELWPILQRTLGNRSGRNNIFICSSFPDNTAIFVSDYLKSKNWQIVYEVRDDMEEFNRVGYSKWFDPMLERRMAQIAHQVITVSPRLSKKMDIIANRTDSVTIPNAVADKLIRGGMKARGAVAEAYRNELDIVGYLGHLTPSWFDWQLVLDAATLRPEYKFEIIGHGMPEELSLPDNVTFLGPKSHDEFLDIATRWRVGLIPFKPSTLTFAVDPNKLYEYLAVGLRVVSAQMGSVDTAPATFVYKTRNQFVTKLDSAMAMRFESEHIDLIETYLSTSNWTTRALTMLQIFEENAQND